MTGVAALRPNPWLVAAGALSAVAAILHICIIFGGPEWYRFFGAGGDMVRAAQAGSSTPAIYASVIAIILFSWSAYAFSGAGLLPRLPLIRTALVLISFIYLARALVLVPIIVFRPWLASPFVWWSSLIVLVYGLCYAVGTRRAWPRLKPLR